MTDYEDDLQHREWDNANKESVHDDFITAIVKIFAPFSYMGVWSSIFVRLIKKMTGPSGTLLL